MNRTKRLAFGIGMVLAVLAVFTASAVADNVVYFDPDPSCAAPGEQITVTLWLDSTDGVAGFGEDVEFDPEVVNLTGGTAGDFPALFACVHYGTFVRVAGITMDGLDLPPGHWKLADLTLVANNSGTSALHHTNFPVSGLFNWTGEYVPNQVWNDGTFNCPCAALKPDLVIFEKYETLEDGSFTATYRVTNIGDGDAGPSTTSITTSDGQSATDSVPALAAGQSYTSTVAGFNCPCGTTVNITVCADNGDVIDESDETNNCLSNELTCLPCELPDLEITDIWTEVKVGKKFNTTRIYYNITNNGDANARRSVSNLTVDGVPTSKRDGVKPLAAGETRTESFRYSKRLGTPTTIKVCADCGKKSIAESDETNNCMEKTVTCTYSYN